MKDCMFLFNRFWDLDCVCQQSEANILKTVSVSNKTQYMPEKNRNNLRSFYVSRIEKLNPLDFEME